MPTVQVPSPQELEAQASIHIDEWVEIGSRRFQELFDPWSQGELSYLLQVGMREPPFLFTDTLGRIWGHGEFGPGEVWFPLHDTVGNKNIGYILPTKVVS